MEVDSTIAILARMDAMTQQFSVVNKKLEKIEAASIKLQQRQISYVASVGVPMKITCAASSRKMHQWSKPIIW
ncbi:hypothetical protein PIB30_114302, partial [Stylosanthes scabra]|nr:hypothetical protein [Stylosanthes scabra]